MGKLFGYQSYVIRNAWKCQIRREFLLDNANVLMLLFNASVHYGM